MNTRKSLYRGLKDVWQILPPAWNDRIRRAPVVGRILELIARVTVKSASHQEIYDKRYNNFLEAATRASTGSEDVYRALRPGRGARGVPARTRARRSSILLA